MGSSSAKANKTKKWVKKFNKENGPGTPLLLRHKEQQELIKESLAKSGKLKGGALKQFGNVLKKKLLHTPCSESKSIKITGSSSTCYDTPTKMETNSYPLLPNNSHSMSKIPAVRRHSSVEVRNTTKQALTKIESPPKSVNKWQITPKAEAMNPTVETDCSTPVFTSSTRGPLVDKSATFSLQRCNRYVNIRPQIIQCKPKPTDTPHNIPRDTVTKTGPERKMAIVTPSSHQSISAHFEPRSMVRDQSRNVSTKSLPAVRSARRSIDNIGSKIPRSNVRMLAAKYESLPQSTMYTQSKERIVSRTSSTKPKPSAGDFECEDENYVCLTQFAIGANSRNSTKPLRECNDRTPVSTHSPRPQSFKKTGTSVVRTNSGNMKVREINTHIKYSCGKKRTNSVKKQTAL